MITKSQAIIVYSACKLQKNMCDMYVSDSAPAKRKVYWCGLQPTQKL